SVRRSIWRGSKAFMRRRWLPGKTREAHGRPDRVRGSIPLSDWDQSRGRAGANGALRGGAMLAAANAGRKLLRLFITILLARLLTPDQFGVVAVATAIFAVVAVFQEFGLSAAT